MSRPSAHLGLLLMTVLYWHAASSREIDKLSSIKDVIHTAVNDAVKNHCPKTNQGDALLSGGDSSSSGSSSSGSSSSGSSRCQRVCPAGFTACAGQCYSLQLAAVNYTSAERHCAELAARLAVPRSHTDNLCVAGLSGGRRVWLGVTDRRREGAFVAADGTPVSELAGHRWAAQQPDDFRAVDPAGEDCVEMATAFRFAEWNDESCASALMPMCQLD